MTSIVYHSITCDAAGTLSDLISMCVCVRGLQVG